MFPGFRDRFDAALDLIVEFSTLGEYGLAAGAAGSPSAPRTGSEQGPRLGGAGGDAARAAGRNVVGGAAASGRGSVPSAPHPGAAATPAARRLAAAGCSEKRDAAGEIRLLALSANTRRTSAHRAPARPNSAPRCRGGAPAPPEQLCLAV